MSERHLYSVESAREDQLMYCVRAGLPGFNVPRFRQLMRDRNIRKIARQSATLTNALVVGQIYEAILLNGEYSPMRDEEWLEIESLLSHKDCPAPALHNIVVFYSMIYAETGWVEVAQRLAPMCALLQKLIPRLGSADRRPALSMIDQVVAVIEEPERRLALPTVLDKTYCCLLV